jgi:gluconokinase
MDADDALARVVGTIDQLLQKTASRDISIEHVAMCAFWHSFVGVDERGHPTTKVLGWADTRARKYSGLLKTRFDENAVHRRTGAHFHSSFWPAKLLWLHNEGPDVFARTAMWLSLSDFVAL